MDSNNIYNGTGDGNKKDDPYASPYEAQRPYQSYLDSMNNQDNQYTYESQINQDSSSSYGNSSQNIQTGQEMQGGSYYDGGNTGAGAQSGTPNYYADHYAYNGQNSGYSGSQPEMEEPVKMSEWVLLQCMISFIPCVGLILAIVWAFSTTEKKSKVNFCKAYLIIFLIKLVLAFVVIGVYGGIMLAAIG